MQNAAALGSEKDDRDHNSVNLCVQIEFYYLNDAQSKFEPMSPFPSNGHFFRIILLADHK